MRMNAAETSASRAIADCTPLTVVSRSSTTAEIDTFISDVSTTSTNIAIASRMATSGLPVPSSGTAGRGFLGHVVPSVCLSHIMVMGAQVSPPHPAGGGSMIYLRSFVIVRATSAASAREFTPSLR